MNVHKKHVYNEPEGSYNNPCNESSGSRINPNYNTLQLEPNATNATSELQSRFIPPQQIHEYSQLKFSFWSFGISERYPRRENLIRQKENY